MSISTASLVPSHAHVIPVPAHAHVIPVPSAAATPHIKGAIHRPSSTK